MTNEIKNWEVTKYKYVKEKYCFGVEAASYEEALQKAKEYAEDTHELEGTEEVTYLGFDDKYEIEEGI